MGCPGDPDPGPGGILFTLAVKRRGTIGRARARFRRARDRDGFLAALTLTVVDGTPLARLAARGRFALPEPGALLGELRVFVDEARPRDALFLTNHASNYLPIGGRLPTDRARLLALVDRARDGGVALRPEGMRGL